ncbi:MAG: ribonuclease Y [Patescibacteria group bacterium]|nr:ribonuclease Y [Patescibacteria group bacterium]
MPLKYFRKFSSIKFAQTELIQKAQQQAQQIINQARVEANQITAEAERKAAEIVSSAFEMEKRLSRKEDSLEEKEKHLDQEKKLIEEKKIVLQKIEKDIEEKKNQILSQLKKIAKLKKEEARDLLLQAWEEKLKREIAQRIKKAEEEIKATVDEKAKTILADAMRYGAIDYVAEYTLSIVHLPNEEFKGRIIGKDGRNIRAFELAIGVDVDLEEENVIKLSSFDAVRREIARISLEKLIKDGRIQPQRIEEIVRKTKEEIEKEIYRAGEDLAHRAGVFNLPREIIQLLGRFKYRYSYGQNMIVHTLEETRIGVAIAHELKADVNVVRLGCLLHDLGKVISEKEGSHVELGVEVLKKYGFPKKVIDCVAAHHEDIPFPSVEAVIVYIADAVSGGRPGARHEDFEAYLKRIKTIEEIAKTKKGVKEAYALQAGRELRVIVIPEEVSDDETVILAQKIKEELEAKFDIFPGQIKITVIREYRAEATTRI